MPGSRAVFVIWKRKGETCAEERTEPFVGLTANHCGTLASVRIALEKESSPPVLDISTVCSRIDPPGEPTNTNAVLSNTARARAPAGKIRMRTPTTCGAPAAPGAVITIGTLYTPALNPDGSTAIFTSEGVAPG